MILSELLQIVKPVEVIGNTNSEITGIAIDSRRVKEGYLFVAVRGTQADGHQFIDKAIELGARAVVCEHLPEAPTSAVAYIVVQN